MKNKKGFTLIEVLIVVVIIAVMATLMIPRMFGLRERGIVAEATQMLSAIRQSQETYSLENGTYTDNMSLLEFDSIPSSKEWAFTTNNAGLSTATRSLGENATTTITLNAAGEWGGNHPLSPSAEG